MPDRKQITEALDQHREKMGDTMEEINEEVRGKMASAKRAVMFVPDKIKAAGSAGKRASGKVVAFAKENPVKAAAIGAATVGLIGVGIAVARRRKSKPAAKRSRAKASAKSGKRRPSR